MVVRHKTCCGRGSVDSMGDVCRATFYVVRPCCVTKIVNQQMSVHFKRNSCDIMVSQRYFMLSDVIWTYFCHFLRCSRAKFIKKIVNVWTLVAQQLFAWQWHVLCHTTLLYKVVWLNCCPCGRTLTIPDLQTQMAARFLHEAKQGTIETVHNCRSANILGLEM